MINYWMLMKQPLLLMGALPIVAGALISWVGIGFLAQSAAFVENLQQTEARVLRFTPGDPKMLMDVEFEDSAGVRHAARFEVDESDAPNLRAIGKVSVVFDRRNPQTAEMGHILSANNEKFFDMGVAGFGALLTLFGLGYIAARARRVLAVKRLFQSGQLVQTEVRDRAMAPGSSVGRFTYAFRGPNGRWYEGKSPELSAEQLAEWPVGRAVVAAYDPLDPKISEPDVFGVLHKWRDVPQVA
jgi:hypothetical protein